MALSSKLERSENKRKALLEGIYYYARPSSKWDGGKKARESLTNFRNPHYKPINYEIAELWRRPGISAVSPEDLEDD